MHTISKLHIGVDVSKDSLDIYLLPLSKRYKIPNTKSEILKFIKSLTEFPEVQITSEATGGYEKKLALVCQKYSYDLWIVDPRRIKGFIISTGCKGKTDKIDAQKIAEFSSKNEPVYRRPLKKPNYNRLQSLVDRKNDITKFLAAEKTRLKHPTHSMSIKNIKKMISFFKKETQPLDQQIQKFIKNHPELDTKTKILETIPGIGTATAALLVAHVPEIGALSSRKISAFVGLCPYTQESGKYKGKARIRSGRKVPRNALYMCALAAIKYHSVLKKFHTHLIEKGKPFKVAIVAVMHKLIIIANTF